MFDIMIIDDDLQVRERLKSMIDWDSLPIRLVCEAADSDTAMELYLVYRPKIIITDINIPIISGLDLAVALQKEDPELQFIVITGYNDFELVRKSVDLGAVDLLSKPIFSETINKSLLKAVDHFRKMQEETSSVQFLKRLVENNLPQMQETFITNLICSPPDDVTRLEAQVKQLEIDCGGPFFAVVMLAMQMLQGSEADQETTILLLRDTLSANMIHAGFHMLSYVDSHSRLNCIIGSEDQEPDNTIEEILTRTREQMRFMVEAEILAGIGPTVCGLAKLYESRSGAMTALNYQCVLGSSSVMHFKNMKQMDTIFHTQETIHHYLLQMFRENNLSAITTTLRNHVTVLTAYGGKQERRVQNFLFEYVQNIINEALRLGLTPDRIERYVPTVVHLMQKDSSAEHIEDVVLLTEQILNCLFLRHTNESNYLVNRAKEYIRQKLSDEQLCLETVSDYVGLSRIYFCKLFHQVEGISFSNYLKQERLERAKDLLLTTNMKVFEISNTVGFSNAKYFSFVFKQTVGLTPVEFQRQPRG
ncbi:MAG: response regulator [Oscillospiraceae bacterium]|nr:response regulator [Oscillospiraceae bacterium]